MTLSRTLRTIALALATGFVSLASALEAPPAYQIPNTIVHELPSRTTQRRYQVWIDLPASYAGSDRKFPVVFVTDPQYAFTLVHGIRHLLGRRGQNIEDFILVGLSLAVGDDPAESRSRDYTPTDPLGKPGRDPGLYGARTYGEAAAYRDYVEAEVFRLVGSTYRADMNRTTFIGHSYGSLFGAYTLLTKPGMFQTYILGSPSLWFDQKAILKIEEHYSREHRDLKARVMLYAGSYETVRPGARYYRKNDLVKDLLQFEEVLKRRRYAGLRIGSQIVPGEDHYTVFPATIGRGLLWALPGFGPYTSG